MFQIRGKRSKTTKCTFDPKLEAVQEGVVWIILQKTLVDQLTKLECG